MYLMKRWSLNTMPPYTPRRLWYLLLGDFVLFIILLCPYRSSPLALRYEYTK